MSASFTNTTIASGLRHQKKAESLFDQANTVATKGTRSLTFAAIQLAHTFPK
jgi:hypothetical protein